MYTTLAPLLILITILIATNPTETRYLEYTGITAKSSQLNREIISTFYCEMNSHKTGVGCKNFMQLSAEMNPTYLEEWWNSHGGSLFTRNNFLVFSYYDIPFDTKLVGDSVSNYGNLRHIGFLNNFVRFEVAGLALIVILLVLHSLIDRKRTDKANTKHEKV